MNITPTQKNTEVIGGMLCCLRCWVYNTHGFGCATSYFEEFPKDVRIAKLLHAVRDAIERKDREVALCALTRLEEELEAEE